MKPRILVDNTVLCALISNTPSVEGNSTIDFMGLCVQNKFDVFIPDVVLGIIRNITTSSVYFLLETLNLISYTPALLSNSVDDIATQIITSELLMKGHDFLSYNLAFAFDNYCDYLVTWDPYLLADKDGNACIMHTVQFGMYKDLCITTPHLMLTYDN